MERFITRSVWCAGLCLSESARFALRPFGEYRTDSYPRCSPRVLYVARACGLGEEVLPVAAVDESFNLTLSQFRAPHEVGEPTSAAESAAIKRSAEAAGQSSEHQPKEKTEEEKKEDSNRASFKPSLLLDLENNRPMELEPIIGAVVERARAKGVDTPRLDFILAALKPSQLAFISAARARTPASADTSNAELSAASHLAGRSNAFGPTPITTPHVEGMGVKGPWPAGAPVVENKTGYF